MDSCHDYVDYNYMNYTSRNYTSNPNHVVDTSNLGRIAVGKRDLSPLFRVVCHDDHRKKKRAGTSPSSQPLFCRGWRSVRSFCWKRTNFCWKCTEFEVH